MADIQESESRLTASSKVALDWASWFAAERTEAPAVQSVAKVESASASRPRADTIDLLLGILFAHPADSEPLQLLDHFDIPLASLHAGLPDDRRVDASALPHGAPQRIADVDLELLWPAVRLAGSLAERSGAKDGLTRLADLFGALIQSPSDPAPALLQRLLEERRAQVDIAVLGSEYVSYLSGLPTMTYASFLAQAHPWTPRSAFIAGYDADAVRPAVDRSDVEFEPSPPQDFIGIGPEVDAFAYLVSARALIPPLAIGLFGDWGSGKSFFMQALQRRVDRITEKARASGTPQRNLPIHKYVAQIQFNAWHYVEGNLWASLVEHIFSNLRTSPTDKPDLLLERRKRVTANIASAQLAKTQVEQDIEKEKDRLQKARAERAKLEQDRLDRLQELERTSKQVAATLATNLQHEVGPMLTSMGYPQVGASVSDLADAVAETRAVLQRGNGVVGHFRDGGPRWVLAIIAVILLGPLVSVAFAAVSAVTGWNISTATTVMASVAAVLSGGTALLRRGNAWTTGQLRKLEDAEQKIQAARAQLEAKGLEADKKIASIEADLRAKQEAEQSLTTRIVDLNRELQAITPGKVLSDFIDLRVGSDDYRKHLGLTALVRQDFEDLWRLVAREERAFLELDGGVPAAQGETPEARDAAPPGEIGRIVLYIDDLDRCPPRVVVNVLQAIHLLLAFPLFVVVVAVDARWLSRSLQKHYGELLGRPGFVVRPDVTAAADGDETASPDDYLEKIFQVPFWVRPLDMAGRSRILQGLVTPSLAVDHAGGPASPSAERTSHDGEDPAVVALSQRLMADQDEPHLHPQSLEITLKELAFMESLSPLLGDSPRAVKRFVNVYRLMKSLAIGEDEAFLSEGPRASYKLVLFLLAVVTGLPGLSPKLFRALREPLAVTTTITTFAISMEAAYPSDAAVLKAWAAAPDNADWGTLMLSELVPWSRQLARFSFRSEVA